MASAKAKGFLDRGYRVEQEQAIVMAVRSWLDEDAHGTFAVASMSARKY